MYFASLTTEEGQGIAFHIAYIDPDNPDPSPPMRIRDDRWGFVGLGERLPFDIPALNKLAKASDPRSSSLAVFHNDKGRIFVWGLIDQGNQYLDFVTYNKESGPERPGVFQAGTMEPGHLQVFCGYELLADYRINEIRRKALDPLDRGPVRKALDAGIQKYLSSVAAEVRSDFEPAGEWDDRLANDWVQAIRRLLIRIQQYRHGGAILVTPDTAMGNLNSKYSLQYSRLRTCLARMAVYRTHHSNASEAVYELLESDEESIPVALHLEESIAESELDEARTEIDGVLWFVSLLSRVDGCVVLGPELDVVGFGVEIQTPLAPTSVVRAGNATASPSKRTPLDYNHFGTRHRSMMRYCAATPGSVGFVVSQDGDARAMTLVDGTLVVWDNLKLRLDDFDETLSRTPTAAIARALLDSGRYREAEAVYSNLIEAEPRQTSHLVNRARARIGLGDAAAARADLERILEENPGLPLGSLVGEIESGALQPKARQIAGSKQEFLAAVTGGDLERAKQALEHMRPGAMTPMYEAIVHLMERDSVGALQSLAYYDGRNPGPVYRVNIAALRALCRVQSGKQPMTIEITLALQECNPPFDYHKSPVMPLIHSLKAGPHSEDVLKVEAALAASSA
jgi:tetratricopeptide (TPR) repeat protein